MPLGFRNKDGSKLGFQKGRITTEEHRKKLSKMHKKFGMKPPSFKGRKHSEKTKEKLKLKSTGNKNALGMKLNEEQRRKISEYRKGKKLSIKTRRKIGEKIKGQKHWNWQGGATSEDEKIRKSIDYKIWHKAVLERDYFVCQGCGQTKSKFNVHHILSFLQFPHKRFDISNGITLCISCHKKIHKERRVKIGR